MSKKILMIDDDLVEIEMVKDVLEKEGYEFHSANDGEEGVNKVSEVNPHLVIADLIMPEKDGFEVCEAIKGNPLTKDIPIIVLSGFEADDLEKRCLAAGAIGFIRKPFKEKNLVERIGKALKGA